MREGLKLILAGSFPRATFGEARLAPSALRPLKAEKWDLALLDMSASGRGGLETLLEFKRSRPRLPVIVVGLRPDSHFSMRVWKAGAAGYLTSESHGSELAEAVKKVTAGGRHISPQLTEQLASCLDQEERKPPHERLSNREFLILRLIASGESVSQIAAKLSLSISTVSTYRRRVLHKMGLANNAQLTHYAMQKGLVN